MKKKKNYGNILVQRVRKKLKHYTAEKVPEYWLDTGSPALNSALGSRDKGLPYGKMYEIFGRESSGKTALLLELAGMAQRDGAAAGIVNAEGSYDEEWAKIRGVDTDNIAVFTPYIGKFGRETRLSTAEDLFNEVKVWLRIVSRKHKKIFLAVDSIPALLPSAGDVDEDDVNMPSRLSLPTYLAGLMPRLNGPVIHRNVMMFFVNQLRSKPGPFGGEYTPGGNTVKFFFSVRAKVKRAEKGGKIVNKKGRQIGIKGYMTNYKNKAGGGSIENIQIMYKVLFRKPSKFMEV